MKNTDEAATDDDTEDEHEKITKIHIFHDTQLTFLCNLVLVLIRYLCPCKENTSQWKERSFFLCKFILRDTLYFI